MVIFEQKQYRETSHIILHHSLYIDFNWLQSRNQEETRLCRVIASAKTGQ
jgi:hypothetical protein